MVLLLTSILSLPLFSLAAPSQQKRDVISSTIFAYGEGISGLPVIVADKDLLYIGNNLPDFANSTSNLTLNTNSTSYNTPWTLENSTSLQLYINLNSTLPVGLTSNTSLPDTIVTTGFTWFGTRVAYVTSTGDVEMQFWAVETNTTELWSLVWNTNGTGIEGGVPVSLKRGD